MTDEVGANWCQFAPTFTTKGIAVSETIEAADYLALGAKQRKGAKYGNTITELDGHRFDSLAELRRYGDLQAMLAAGEITSLVMHPRYKLIVGGVLVCTYSADFRYVRDGVEVVEDVKSEPTRRKEAYRIKKKLFEAIHHPLTITEVSR